MIRFTDAPLELPLPLHGHPVAAGFPSPADDHLEGSLDLNRHLVRRPAATFFVRARGESMRDAGIFDGDLLIVDRSLNPRPGDVVIVAVDGEFCVKRLCGEPGAGVLGSDNPDFPDLAIDSESRVEIWGVVRSSVRSHRER
ncbi:MAG: translesion error-prone DNA polymerase V autoproteolytic subunit [Proteobacteria bacterium]|nr:translesion error-prone DNA polymerase V autoproteolytic subunit [Pseudomonadota bacterium]